MFIIIIIKLTGHIKEDKHEETKNKIYTIIQKQNLNNNELKVLCMPM